MRYKFEIIETLRNVVEVEAYNKEEAYEKAWENYMDEAEGYVLTDAHHQQTEIFELYEPT